MVKYKRIQSVFCMEKRLVYEERRYGVLILRIS